MSQWEDVNGVSTEVGLSPGQTAGSVGGSYVERPAGSDTATPYYSHEAKKEQNVYRDPQTQRGITADEAIRRGLEGGWRIGDTYYLTEQAARNDMQRLQAITGMPRASGAATPQEIMLKKKGYKAYTTIEGTTIYTRPNTQEIIIPKYGKMIPVEEFRRLHPTPVMKAQEKIAVWDKQLSEKMNLKEGVFQPALELYRKANIAWAETLPEEQRKRALSTDSAPTRFIIGAGGKLAKEPLTFAGNLAFALLVTKGMGGLVSKVPLLAKGVGIGKVARNINAVNILGASLASMYGYDVTTRYAAAPDKAKFLGELTATELVPFTVGGYIGSRTSITPALKAMYKQTSRQSAIAKINLESSLRRQYKQQSKALDEFIRAEEATTSPKKRYRQELVQILKPKELETVKEVEIIRADVALAKQLLIEKYAVSQRAKPVVRLREPKTVAIDKSKMTLIPLYRVISGQEPVVIQDSIMKAVQILKPEAIAIQKPIVIAIQEPIVIAIQKSIAIQEAVALQKAIAIQQTKTVQEAKTILKTKKSQKAIERPITKKIKPFRKKTYGEELDELIKKKKKRKYVWNIENPVPTLRQLLGSTK